MAAPGISDRLSTLSRTLWRQRTSVEMLLFRLEVQHLILASGRHRWIDRSARDVDRAIADVYSELRRRASALAAVAPLLGVPESASLSELADAAGDPWDQILEDHQAAFLAFTESVEAVSRNNREMLERGLRDTRVEMETQVTDLDEVEAIIALQAQEMAFRDALAVSAKVIQPAVLQRLR